MWANESFEVSKSTVYNGVQPNVALSDEYQTAAQAALKKQIVLGGYRLAYMIETIFGGASAETSFLKWNFHSLRSLSLNIEWLLF